MTFEQAMVIVILLLAFLSVAAIAYTFSSNPYHGNSSEKPKTYPTVQQVKELNAQYAAKRAKKEIEVERGKILAFSSKPWYRSAYKKKSLDD